MRQPIIGILPPGGKFSQRIQPPMVNGEQAVLVAPGKDIRYYPPISGDDPCVFTLENGTQQVIAFSLVIVPGWIVGVANFPWRRFIIEARRQGGLQRALSAVLNRVLQLQSPSSEDDK